MSRGAERLQIIYDGDRARNIYATGWFWQTAWNYDWVAPSPGHAGEVASIIAARKDNVYGLSGVAPGAVILPVSVDGSIEAINAAIRYVTYETDAKIINMSIQLSNKDILEHSASYRDALLEADARGLVVVLIAGNGGRLVDWDPTYDSHAIVVGALNSSNGREWYDGPGNGSNYGTRIDVSASGQNILTYQEGVTKFTNTGTSYAAPIVSGLVSLLQSIAWEKQLNNETVRRLLAASSDIGPTNGVQMGYEMWNTNKNSVGYGARIVDFLQAMQMLAWSKSNNYTGFAIRTFNSDDRVISKHEHDAWWANNLNDVGYMQESVVGGGARMTNTFNFASWNQMGARTFGGSIIGWKNGQIYWNCKTGGFVERRNPSIGGTSTLLSAEVPYDYTTSDYIYYSLDY
jgi:subtilisin family serine protease